MKMSHDALQPDVIAYSAALNAFEKSSQWAWAVDLLANILQHSVEANSIILGAAASACQAAMQWTLALDLLTAMSGRGLALDSTKYSAGAFACRKDGQWVSCGALLQRFVHERECLAVLGLTGG